VREAVGTGRDGASADQLLRAARWFGLRGRGVRVDLEELELLEPGTVLHWQA
jgi:ATP-binding cassette, subfamily B, bacterial